MMLRLVTTLGLMAGLAACADSTPGQHYGGAGGAAVGAAVGRAISHGAEGTGVGALAGLAVGIAAGTFVDPPGDKERSAALVRAAETGQPATWATKGTRNGTVTPTQTRWTNAAGHACQTLRHDTSIDGHPITRDVTACKDQDATWIIADMAE